MGGSRAEVRRIATPAATRRQMIGTVLAGLILGLGSVTIGTTLVQASERDGLTAFFERLFGAPQRAAIAAPRQPTRYANLPEPRLQRAQRSALHTPRTEAAAFERRLWMRRPRRDATVLPAAGRQTVCVRLCDGYLFPLGTLRRRGDMPVHQAACAAACPNAATSAYTMASGETELDRAVSPEGMPYRASALANVYRQRRVADCSCQPKGGVAHLPIDEDPTLRPGDVVTTADSAGVVTRMRAGSVELTDFRRARLSRGHARQIEARVGTPRRDEQVRGFRRLIQTADRPGLVRMASAGDGFRIPPRSASAEGAVRVIAPSPFTR